MSDTGWHGLTGDTDLSLALSDVDVNSVLYVGDGPGFAGVALTDGQVLVGSTGLAPEATSITGSPSVVVTSGPGSITVNTVQPITTTSSPEFVDVKLSALDPAHLLATDADSKLQSITIVNANGCASSFAGSTLTMSMTQDLKTSAAPTFAGLTSTGAVTAGTNSLTVGSATVASLTSTGTLSAAGVTSTGPISAGTNTLTGGATSVGSLTSAGTLSAAGITAAGPITAGTHALTAGSTTVSSLTSTGALTATLITASSRISAGTNALLGGSAVLSAISNQLKLGGTTFYDTQTINSGLPRTVLIPDTAGGSAFLMTDANQTINGTLTFATPPAVLVSTPSSLLSVDASRSLQSTTLAAASNGISLGFAGSTLSVTASQNLATTGTPTFATVTCTGTLSAAGITSTAAIDSGTFALRGGAISGSTLSLTGYGIGASGLLGLNSAGTLITNAITTTNGMSFIVGVGSGITTINTPQDIRTTASPTFVGVNLATTGGTPATLNYYETYTHATSWNGAYGASSVTGNLRVTRVGRVVTVTFPSILGVCTSINPLWMITNMPARFCPPEAQYICSGLVQTATGTIVTGGVFFITTGGNFQIHNGVGQTFSNVGSPTVGLPYACSVSYNVS